MSLIVGIDFDGTLVEHEYPKIGPELPHAFNYLHKLRLAGAKLILWTMRSENTLQEAVEFCRRKGIEFWGVNSNPEQHVWTKSNKAYCHVYIDDAALGCPLIQEEDKRPYVDWQKVGPIVMEMVKK